MSAPPSASVVKLDRPFAAALSRGGPVLFLAIFVMNFVHEGGWILLLLLLALVGLALMIVPVVRRPRIRITDRAAQLPRRLSVPRDVTAAVELSPLEGAIFFLDANRSHIGAAVAGRHLADVSDALVAHGWPAPTIPHAGGAGAEHA